MFDMGSGDPKISLTCLYGSAFHHCHLSSLRDRHFKAQDFDFFILLCKYFPPLIFIISLSDTWTDRLSNFLVSFGFKYYELALVPSEERTHFLCRREISSICKEQSPSFIMGNRRLLRAHGNYPCNEVLWSPAPSRSSFKIQFSRVSESLGVWRANHLTLCPLSHGHFVVWAIK